MNMTKCAIMNLPNNFKIRKKSDIDVFINDCMQNDTTYVLKIDSSHELYLDKDKENIISISERKCNLKNPFNPSIEIAKQYETMYDHCVEYYIWKYRKYINAKWFSNKFL